MAKWKKAAGHNSPGLYTSVVKTKDKGRKQIYKR
jgi:hypothetical protein